MLFNTLTPSTLLIFVGAICVALGSLWAASEQANFNAKLNEKNEQIIAIQKGSNVCSFWIIADKPNESGEFPLMAENVGPFPVYDVDLTVRRIRYGGGRPLDAKAIADIMHDAQHTAQFEVGNVPMGLKQTSVFLKPGFYQINIRTRFGRFTEMLRFGPFENGIGQSYVVGDDATKQYIYKNTTPGFSPKTY
jgi:hypothetical protein